MTEISLRFEPPFARIVLSRPKRRNAITRAMWRALPAIRTAIEAREDLLVTLVEGEGAHFSAGADIAELGEIYRDAASARSWTSIARPSPSSAASPSAAGLAWRSPAT
jgi:enoyl-CoA hydratase/carnithine racemase